jgi:hypothetical protein
MQLFWHDPFLKALDRDQNGNSPKHQRERKR